MKINKEEWLNMSYEYPFKKSVSHNIGSDEATRELEGQEIEKNPKQDIERAIWHLQRYLEKE